VRTTGDSTLLRWAAGEAVSKLSKLGKSFYESSASLLQSGFGKAWYNNKASHPRLQQTRNTSCAANRAVPLRLRAGSRQWHRTVTSEKDDQMSETMIKNRNLPV
jgi:hypothetical protein